METRKETIDRTILLAKADLVSNMIGEKSLQNFKDLWEQTMH